MTDASDIDPCEIDVTDATDVPPSEGDEPIRGWMVVLDELTYYELFGIEAAAGVDEVRGAFHAFCDTFHPDRHFGRHDAEREAVSMIFKRGTEAYLVLCDGALRAQYDADLAARADRAATPGSASDGAGLREGESALRIRFSAHSRPPSSMVPGPVKLEDVARTPGARPFARRAEELIRAGDLRQAKLQLVMANHLDPGNDALAAAMREIEAKLAGPR